MGGKAVRDAPHDASSCQLKYHNPSGEITFVTFSRDAVQITSYQDDAIRTTVERLRRTVCRRSGERGTSLSSVLKGAILKVFSGFEAAF